MASRQRVLGKVLVAIAGLAVVAATASGTHASTDLKVIESAAPPAPFAPADPHISNPPTTTTSTTRVASKPTPRANTDHTQAPRASRSVPIRIAVATTAPKAIAPVAEVAPVGGLPAGLVCIGNHEGAYSTNTGNGYSGRYQYTRGTWNRYGGYVDAYLAPAAVQDRRALSDYNLGPTHRHHEWPNSSRKCGV